MSATLEVEDLSVEFEGYKALDSVNLEVDRGELRFLIGPNGAGKTTLVDCITGLTRAASGDVRFEGRSLGRMGEHRRVRLGIGRSFQTPTVFEKLTVLENLDLADSFRRPFPSLFLRRRGVTESVAEALTGVGLEGVADRPAAVLSHGQKQWLEIGMLLVQRPKLLLLDEPVAGMSPQERLDTGALLHKLAGDHTVVVIEHDMAFLRRFAHRVTVLHEGRVVSEGSVEEVQADPIVRQVYLGRSRDERSGAVAAGAGGIGDRGEPVNLELDNVRMAYGRTEVVFGVSLDVPDGSLLCLMGRNGVGKTTLLNGIMGVTALKDGRVLLDGRDISNLKTPLRARAGIGYVPQGHQVFPHLTAWENLQVVLERDRQGDPAAVDEALDIFPALRPLLQRPAGLLSGGQAQQLAIARSLVSRPKLLMLDEPTEGIQPSIILEIEDAIAELHRSGGMTVVLVEQYVEFALRLAQRYAVMEGGIITHSGEAGDVELATLSDLLAV